MSLVMSASMNRATFALQSRLFVAMKRAGRVIDLVWFQHSAEYARAVLDTAARMSDTEVTTLAENLRQLLGDYLNQTPIMATVLPLRPPVALPNPASEPLPASGEPASVETPAALDRHLTSLR